MNLSPLARHGMRKCCPVSGHVHIRVVDKDFGLESHAISAPKKTLVFRNLLSSGDAAEGTFVFGKATLHCPVNLASVCHPDPRSRHVADATRLSHRRTEHTAAPCCQKLSVCVLRRFPTSLVGNLLEINASGSSFVQDGWLAEARTSDKCRHGP